MSSLPTLSKTRYFPPLSMPIHEKYEQTLHETKRRFRALGHRPERLILCGTCFTGEAQYCVTCQRAFILKCDTLEIASMERLAGHPFETACPGNSDEYDRNFKQYELELSERYGDVDAEPAGSTSDQS